MRLYFLTIPKPLKQYTLFKKRLSIPLSDPRIFLWSNNVQKQKNNEGHIKET
jgi:hypothetical protein